LFAFLQLRLHEQLIAYDFMLQSDGLCCIPQCQLNLWQKKPQTGKNSLILSWGCYRKIFGEKSWRI